MRSSTNRARTQQSAMLYGAVCLSVALFTASCGMFGIGGGQPPRAPSNLSASVLSASRIDLSWVDNSTNEEGFKIERWKEGESPDLARVVGQVADAAPRSLVHTAAENAVAYSDTGLEASTTYHYRICAFNSAGDSAYAQASATTLATGPAGPSGLTLTVVSPTRIDLSWTDNSSDEELFRIQRKTGAGGTYANLVTVPANTTVHHDTTLTPDTTYYYRVCAWSDAAGDSAYVEAFTSTPAALTLASLSTPGPNTAVVVLDYGYAGSDFVAGREYVYELGLYYPPDYAAIEFRKPDVGLGNCRARFDIEDVAHAGAATTNGGTNNFTWSEPGGSNYYLAQTSQIYITSPYTGIPGSSFAGEGAFLVTAGDYQFTIFVKFKKTEAEMVSDTSIEFLADFFTTYVLAVLAAAFAPDEDPDPDTWRVTVAGTNGGTHVETLYTNPVTGDKTGTLVFTDYDQTGTSYSSVPSIAYQVSAAGDGTMTGKVITTGGTYHGWIIADLTLSAGGDTGTWNVGGTTYTHAELLAYLGQ